MNNINVNLYSYGYSLNFLKLNIPHINLISLIKEHEYLNPEGFELPIDSFFKTIKELKNFLQIFKDKYKLSICFDNILNINEDLLICLISENINQVRIRMPQTGKTIYGGNKHLYQNFDEQFNDFINQLNKFKSFCLSHNMKFCIENHQDLHSEDLLKIINVLGSDFIGINWDIGNSIACCERPDEFYQNCKDFIFNIHLKDYHVVKKHSYIKLVRARFGEGFLKECNPSKYVNLNVSKSLELGSQISRKCFIFNDLYWISNGKKNKQMKTFCDFIEDVACLNDYKSDYENNLSHNNIVRNEKYDFELSYKKVKEYI